GLVNGMVEWPAVVSNEPFLVVRGDSGALYYVGIAGARREGAVAAGSRVSVLGLEGPNPHEITAVARGCGPSAEAGPPLVLGPPPPTGGPGAPPPRSRPRPAPGKGPGPRHWDVCDARRAPAGG